jgi:hypothetical protein
MQIVLHLRFWPKLREKFQAAYASTLQPAYDAIGIQQPDWSKITRIGLKAHMDAVKKAFEGNPDAASKYKALLDKYVTKGIHEFKDEEVIPKGWI